MHEEFDLIGRCFLQRAVLSGLKKWVLKACFHGGHEGPGIVGFGSCVFAEVMSGLE